MLSSSPFGSAFAKGFVDVSADFEYGFAIRNLANLNIVNGYEDGTFRPESEINRAEFIKIVIEAEFPGEAVGSGCFKDVANQWFAPYICFAKDRGFIAGYADKTFRPEQSINFVEASKIIANVFSLDVEEKYIETWFEKYVVALENIEAIPGSIFNFDQKVKRGEMSFMIDAKLNSWGGNGYNTSVTYADIRALSGLGAGVKKLAIDRFYSSGDMVYEVEFGKAYLVKGANANSFQHLYDTIYKDENNIYVIEIGNLIHKGVTVYSDLDLDLSSFELVYSSRIGDFLKDKDSLYYVLNDGFTFAPRRIDSFEADNFELIRDTGYVVLFSDQKNLYMAKQMKSYLYESDDIIVKQLDFVDLDSFRLLTSSFENGGIASYFVDNRKMYCFGCFEKVQIAEGFYYIVSSEFLTEVSGLDLETVQAIDLGGGFSSEKYFKDRNGVYLANGGDMVQIDGADGNTFEVVFVFDIFDQFSPRYPYYYLRDDRNIWVLNPNGVVEKIAMDSVEDFDYEKYLEDQGVKHWQELG